MHVNMTLVLIYNVKLPLTVVSFVPLSTTYMAEAIYPYIFLFDSTGLCTIPNSLNKEGSNVRLNLSICSMNGANIALGGIPSINVQGIMRALAWLHIMEGQTI